MTRLRLLDWPALAMLAALLLAWEILPKIAESRYFPPASVVFTALWTHLHEISAQLLHTLRRAGIGFLLALVTMAPLGILIGRVRWLAVSLEPVIDLLRPLPPLAIVPVIMLFAGTGDGAKITVITYAASFPILIHAIDGVRGIHPMYAIVASSLRLTRREALFLVDLPATLPVIFTGIRLAVANALLVAVTSEMLLSSNGMGLFILETQETFQIAKSMAGIVVIALLGWLVSHCVQLLNHRLLAWHYATTGDQAGEGKSA